MNNLHSDLDRLYCLLAKLEETGVQGKRLDSYAGHNTFPARGVYFFREVGECRTSDPNTLRIVRVGTHAVSANAKSTLRSRLKAHLGTRRGGGNHRGSIFRLHVGTALLARDEWPVPTWGVGSTTPDEVRTNPVTRAAEAEWEQRVSSHIGAMTVLWVNVPGEPGPDSMRARIEQNAIALLSNQCAPLDVATSGWLGHHSPRLEIRQSGLWNLNYVRQPYDPDFLNDLEIAVELTRNSSLDT